MIDTVKALIKSGQWMSAEIICFELGYDFVKLFLECSDI